MDNRIAIKWIVAVAAFGVQFLLIVSTALPSQIVSTALPSQKEEGTISRHRGAQSADDSPRILLLGLPRSGSKSVHDFVTCMRPDWSSAHYCCDDDRCERTCGECVHSNCCTVCPPFKGVGTTMCTRNLMWKLLTPLNGFCPSTFVCRYWMKEFGSSTIDSRNDGLRMCCTGILLPIASSIPLMFRIITRTVCKKVSRVCCKKMFPPKS